MVLTRRAVPDVHTAFEEILHTASHGIGILLAILALILLVAKAAVSGGVAEITAVSIFAVSALVLYASSTLYHGAFRSRFQPFLETIDHSAIYLKIAGSYTPFALLVLSPVSGTIILVTVWVLAIAGITLKFLARHLSDPRKYEVLSLAGYLGMGWVGVFVIGELWAKLPAPGFAWLIAGGLCFTVGALFFAWKSRAFTHTIFHVFVLAGSICHFVSIYGYVL
ncbi:hemolysin III family protein [Parvularcula sp. IMCC14364]|uniref:PAQR family membrane homeostasis protein TrhA n=1 Tax=Parvularcula sp. IMCC14364 TaxID=3067902 RepID=UPI002741E792|nr:hemolysin III family protein [Parvularcula sp. IMCC14364]